MNDNGASGAFRSSRTPRSLRPWGRAAAGKVTAFLNDETAATVVEYGLIVAVLSIAGLAGAPTVGSKMLGLYNRVVTAFP